MTLPAGVYTEFENSKLLKRNKQIQSNKQNKITT